MEGQKKTFIIHSMNVEVEEGVRVTIDLDNMTLGFEKQELSSNEIYNISGNVWLRTGQLFGILSQSELDLTGR